MTSKLATLTPREQAFYLLVRDQGDVPIRELYASFYGRAPGEPLRRVQNALGTYVSRINRKIKGWGQRIMPGEARGTYRLADIG